MFGSPSEPKQSLFKLISNKQKSEARSRNPAPDIVFCKKLLQQFDADIAFGIGLYVLEQLVKTLHRGIEVVV